MAASVTVAAIGIFLALSWYVRGKGKVPEELAQRFPGVYRTLSNKYYVDEVYEAVFVQGLALDGGLFLWEVDATVVDLIPNGSAALVRGLSWISSAFDQYVVDGLVNGVANTLQAAFRVFRRAETGRVQNYALFMGAGLFAIVTVYLFFR
jgi:NADH-quinone oxidoreductase subunit L